MPELHSVETLPPLPVAEGVEFRHIPGFIGYAAGTNGAILTCWRKNPAWWRALTPARVGKSRARRYQSVALYGNGNRKNLLVHRLILITFVGPPPDGHQACHNDGNPHNNSLANLRWDTAAANTADRVGHGTYITGEAVGNASMTNEVVLRIKRLLSQGINARVVSDMEGIKHGTVRAIKCGQNWKHLDIGG